MVSSLQRNSSQAYRFMQSHKDGEATIKQFHNLTRLFEAYMPQSTMEVRPLSTAWMRWKGYL
jgi:hypothetical protein